MNANNPKGERVRKSTSSERNTKIDLKTIENIRRFPGKSPTEISRRIKDLDKEWDIERVLEVNMSVIALTGIGLTVFVHAYWIILPSIVLIFFLQHALQGWCLPIPLFRALGVRTRPEIDREKYARKALRGDFSGVHLSVESPDTAFRAAKMV
jgi:hypothetical protein